MKNNLQQSIIAQGMGIISLILGIVDTVITVIFGISLISFFLGVLSITIGTIGFFHAKNVNGSIIIPRIGLISGIVSIVFLVIWLFAIAGVYAIVGI
ncbi:hypothetical protein ACFSJW_05765 [Flavobacterium artemisiae]|uniref:DUF4190 domain-containing protein n=1 Tax=Flavobacterium artemisiae TaxID=2126556 RepID=A0ABW4HHC4_9FLAO